MIFLAGYPSHWPGIAQIGAGAAFRMGYWLVGVALEPSWRLVARVVVAGLTGTLAAVPGSVARLSHPRFSSWDERWSWRRIALNFQC